MVATISEARTNARYRVSYKWVKLHSGRSEYIGIVSNISGTGMMVSGNLDLMVGDHVQVGMQGDSLISGRVKWRKDKAAGIAFDAPMEVQDFLSTASASQNGSPPRTPRFRRTAELAVRTNSGNFNASLVNISPSGICIEGLPGLRLQESVYVDLGPLGRCKGHVCWTDGDTAGIAFTRMLRIADLSEWLSRSQAII